MMPLSNIPFILRLDPAPFYGHDTYPNHVYRRNHPRHHEPLDMHTLGLIARLGPHAQQLVAAKHAGGDMHALPPTLGKNGFEVHLDVGLFEPEDLSVKVVNDSIVIEGKHEEREDEHGHITRHFVRRYPLPKGYDPEAILSTLSIDGALTVRIPKPEPNEDGKTERVVPIKHTGEPSELFLKSKSQDEREQKEEKEKKKKDEK